VNAPPGASRLTEEASHRGPQCAGRVCCIKRSQVILAGRFTVGTQSAHRGPRCEAGSARWEVPGRLPAVRFTVKIASDRLMQQTPPYVLSALARQVE
jgi:hypothetical protein